MTGSKQIEFGATEWIKGVSTSSEIADGGFSPETDGVNLIKTPGVMYAPAQQVDKSTSVADNIIASCFPQGSLSNDRYFVGDARKYYSWNGTSITLEKTATTGTYTDGKTDLVAFNGSIYATTTTDVTKWNGTSTLDENYWTTTKSQSPLQSGAGEPHPMIVFESSLWIGDGNVLRSINESGTVNGSPLTLAVGEIIYALAIDPASGKLLISTTEGANISDTLFTKCKIYQYDGFSIKPNKAIVVEDLVTSFYVMSGVVYVCYGKNLGIFNGSGIDFLRKFKNVSYTNTSLVYKHRITSINKNLYIADGAQILCYGEIIGGQKKVFYPAMTNSTQISVLTSIGSDKLGFSYSSSKFYTFDTLSSATTNSMTLYSNKIVFPRPIHPRCVYIEYYDAVTNNDNNRTLYYKAQDNAFVLLAIQNGTSLKNESGASVYEIENIVGFLSTPTVKSIQFRYIADTTNFGIKRFIFYFDVAE